MSDSRAKDARQRRLEVARRFAARYDELPQHELASGEDWSFESAHSPLFLGTYSAEGVCRALENYGLLAHLASRGIPRVEASIDTSDPFLHVLRLKEPEGAVFLELRARVALGRDVGLAGRLAELSHFVVEWLAVENPRGDFTPNRPQLPGQRRPGLGAGPEVEELLVLTSRRLGCAALVSWPQWFHNAWLYHPRWMFVDPVEEGRFAALVRDLAEVPLPKLAWAVHLGCVRDLKGVPFEWRPGPLVLPRTREACRHFEAPLYRATRFAARARMGFEVDEARLARALADQGIVLG